MRAVHGVLLIQFQEGRKLRAEASPGQKTAEVSEFTEAAAMYER